MNIVGKWTVYEVMSRDDDLNIVWKKKDEMLKQIEPGDEMAMFLNASLIFTEDGKMLTVAPIPANVPKEEVDAAVAAGKVKLYGDNMMVFEGKDWKEEDGKFFYDSGTQGEIFGEPVSPWVEIKEVEDGVIEILLMRYIKE
ncbi:MAG: hypothetical protein IJM20_01215 [Clostridia bacterium]|jgi:hypothetical protein|nr:hypothetical protein [Clostridia bacterium]